MLVLTVDPALPPGGRVGSGLGHLARRVPEEAFADTGVRPKGELYAAMLDMSESWDALVRRHAPDPGTANEILANPLYRNVTRRFAQGHDYIAMERLHELHEEGEYDLLVVDTPPSLNALDLLDAPGRVAEFFSSRLLRWLIVPYRSRLVNLASRPFYQVADRVLGSRIPRRPGRVLHPVADHEGRFCRTRRGGEPPDPGCAHDIRGRDHARGGPGR